MTWRSYVVAFSLASSLQAGGLVPGVDLGKTRAEVEPVLRRQCASHRVVEVSPPSFPLASRQEAHLICEGLETGGGKVEAVALVFADEELVALEAQGGAVEALGGGEPSGDYLEFRILDGGERWVDEEDDAVWLLNAGARHLNLFTWSNPHLSGNPREDSEYSDSARIPPVLDFDRPLDEQLARFERECPRLEVSPNERIWLPTRPESQVQVNCFGYVYAGFPRKLEAVYGDGRLDVVWILTGQGEEDRVRRALVEAFGEAISVNDQWEVFSGGRVGLRKDKPEVLLLSEEAAPHYRKEIGLE